MQEVRAINKYTNMVFVKGPGAVGPVSVVKPIIRTADTYINRNRTAWRVRYPTPLASFGLVTMTFRLLWITLEEFNREWHTPHLITLFSFLLL